MKYLQMSLIVFLFVLSQIGCHKLHKSGAASQKDKDSLTAAIADSLIRNDPWIRYTYAERQGKQLFEQYCAICHGQSGEGDGFNAYNLNPKTTQPGGFDLYESALMRIPDGNYLFWWQRCQQICFNACLPEYP